MPTDEKQNIPASDRVYVSAIGQSACTISGRPLRLERVIRESKELNDARTLDLPSAGFWHAQHVYGDDHVSEVVTPRKNALERIPSPSQMLVSPSSAKIVEPQSGTALFESSVRDILKHPIQWALVQEEIFRLTSAQKVSADHILGFEGSHVSKSLQSDFEARGGQPITTRNVSQWTSALPDVSSQPQLSPANIAIVGMSGRFPGAPDVEALWKLLEQGRDMHKRIPSDRFDAETHCDPSGKKNNTSHTPFGCFVEEPGLFDARFFNMSPREAAQTDPMHRLALATAYEALEQSGFVLNRTASSQADRVGTFYGQTSDDWREVNGAQEIGTYFIPGKCPRTQNNLSISFIVA